ncbi:chromatin remodeling protein EBS-like [Lycium ferocissimum]|uniref:chromatin remodeling protein EBS-like n=1 Tax=Lycium ferocissimum TaxID=112874 RepID=UPI0028151478|nr:chromatin remodeling protein EBS-like [Lycium ferocissimum]
MIAQVLLKDVAETPRIPIKDCIRIVQTVHGKTISNRKGFLGRSRVFQMIFENWHTSFQSLPRYMAALQHFNAVGDCVLIRPEKANTNPYVARVEEIEPGNKKIRIRWYYSPEETKSGRRQFHGAREVFLSDHYDEQSVDVINGKCRIHTLDEYLSLESVRPEDYYCRFEYKSKTGVFVQDRVAVEVYCKCKMPYNPDVLMIECDKCKKRYHPHCLGMSNEKAEQLKDKQFVCSDC